MNYDLALELKKAEFPFNPNRDWDKSDFVWLPINEITKNDREKLWIPTLSELIEACGKHFSALMREEFMAPDSMWIARADTSRKDVKISAADTPEGAVANLWLSLNKK